MAATSPVWGALSPAQRLAWRQYAGGRRLSGINIWVEYNLPWQLYAGVIGTLTPATTNRVAQVQIHTVLSHYSTGLQLYQGIFSVTTPRPAAGAIIGVSVQNPFDGSIGYQTLDWSGGAQEFAIPSPDGSPPSGPNFEFWAKGLQAGWREGVKNVITAPITIVP